MGKKKPQKKKHRKKSSVLCCGFCDAQIASSDQIFSVNIRSEELTALPSSRSTEVLIEGIDHPVVLTRPKRNSPADKDGITAIIAACSPQCVRDLSKSISESELIPLMDDLFDEDLDDILSAEEGDILYADLQQEVEDALASMDTLKKREDKLEAALDALAIDSMNWKTWTKLADVAKDDGLPARRLGFLKNALQCTMSLVPEEIMEKPNYPYYHDERCRPFLYATEALALASMEVGILDEAIDLFFSILEMNSNDNLGVRFPLIRCLLESGRLIEGHDIVQTYPDASPAWTWIRTGIAAKRKSPRSAVTLMKQAIDQNPHVLDYVRGNKVVPTTSPEEFDVGDDSEAKMIAWVLYPIFETLRTVLALTDKPRESRRTGRGTPLFLV
ncbi:MAG: tetratricopeptide repeat protein [Oligoflexales bacterium]